MSILTKICVVLLLVLVLLACPVLITQATQLPRYMDAVDALRVQNKVAEMSNRTAQLALKEVQSRRDDLAGEVRALAAKNRSLVSEHEVRLSEQVAQNLGSQKQIAKLNASFDRLQQALNMEIARADRITGELNGARTVVNDLKGQVGRLDAELAARDVAIARLEALNRRLRVDKQRLEKEKEALAIKQADIGTARRVATDADHPAVDEGVPLIQGEITAVDDDVASISIGAAKGIKKGMKLIIYRHMDFVSYLQIEFVGLDTAVGVVVNKRLAPRQGDKVRTRVSP